MAISSAVSILEWRVMRQAGEKSRDGTTNADDAAPFSLREPSVKILRLSAGNEPNNSRKRDELINETGEDYARAKDYLDKKKADLEDHKKKLSREHDNNTELEGNVATQERILTKLRD